MRCFITEHRSLHNVCSFIALQLATTRAKSSQDAWLYAVQTSKADNDNVIHQGSQPGEFLQEGILVQDWVRVWTTDWQAQTVGILILAEVISVIV